jgi:hypothetical protein
MSLQSSTGPLCDALNEDLELLSVIRAEPRQELAFGLGANPPSVVARHASGGRQHGDPRAAIARILGG